MHRDASQLNPDAKQSTAAGQKQIFLDHFQGIDTKLVGQLNRG
jgi:hypothetical protein